MIVDFHKGFTKNFKRQPPKIKEKFKERLLVFEKEEFDPVLKSPVVVSGNNWQKDRCS